MPATFSIARPLVSVVVATYNYGKYIGETLGCLQKQTYTNWECIVVDDGSTDDTREVVNAFAARDGRVKYIYQANARQAAARNNALRHIKGEYVGFLDADDLIEKRKFEHHVAYLETHAETDIVYGCARYFSDDKPEDRLLSMSGLNRRWMPETSGAGNAVIRELLCGNMLVVNSALMRRSVVERVGLFDGDLPPIEDWDYFLRCALAGKRFQFLDVKDTHALVRVHPASSSRNLTRFVESELQMRERVAVRLAAREVTANVEFDVPEMSRINARMSVQAEGQLGIQQALNGDGRQGFRRMIRASANSDGLWLKAKWLTYGGVSLVAPKHLFEKIVFTPRTNFTGLWRISSLRSKNTRGEHLP